MVRASAAAIVSLAALGLAGACSGKTVTDNPRICTPGNYVFCRCADRSGGTKLCKADGMSFEACQPCPDASSPGDPPDTGPPDRGDSGPSPDAGSAKIDPACIGKLALVAGTAGSDSCAPDEPACATLTGVYRGGSFDVTSSSGPGVRGVPALVTSGSSLIAVYAGRAGSIVWAKFESSWASPNSIYQSDVAPGVASRGTQVRVIYRGPGADGTMFAATYDSGWDPGNTPAGPGVGQTASAPSLASVGSILAYTYARNGDLNVVLSPGAGWTPSKITGATPSSAAPAITGMNGGTSDFAIVYEGADGPLRSVFRDAASTNWSSASVLVDDGAQPAGSQPALAALPNGGAMLVWREASGFPRYSVYDPSGARPWSAPAELVPGNNPHVTSTPSLAQGRCGGQLVLAYAEDGGGVKVMHYANGAWDEPYPVGGMDGVTYVGVGELP